MAITFIPNINNKPSVITSEKTPVNNPNPQNQRPIAMVPTEEKPLPISFPKPSPQKDSFEKNQADKIS